MDESKATPKAVVLSAILHIGIVGFLFLAILPCSSYENVVNALGLPAWMNPITCSKPLELQGPIIEATLIGPTGSPPPKAVKVKPVPDSTPPPPTVPPPKPAVEAPKVKTLPPPPEHVDVVDQERVVADAALKAEEAKKLQEEKQRQRQSELDAQAAKQKEEKQKQLDALFAKMDAASAQTKRLDNKAKQARQQMEDLKNAQDDGQPDLPAATQRQTGNNSPNSNLADEYAAAIQNAVTPNWLRPDNIPAVPCKVDIVQSPGGDVLSATVDSSCPYDDAGRRSVENAVLRTKTLPYKGFESVFQRKLTFTFRPQ
ncbi:cell envelope integrity protein TolA [Rhodanobacter sp. T12-5]|jgi:colicin import membrane protein|uniref:cell envelope integrity protein TolA n=1 Tax=Rhodanobacter sp. T12-5 TaxID=2024611 RepID=UPI0011EFEC08|nr:cell envelope integrity protein TolA [Rhodanobacter sp. T12-5]KAA0071165.1 protein TolA [Rhodanobacter sp. T12-5]HTH66666.1 cell envelope integrity protein TolA [Rhodanobacter sp.]